MVPEFRALLQRMGTEVGRNLLGESVWADACLRHIPRLLVLSDALRSRGPGYRSCGGLVVRVERPGYGPSSATSVRSCSISGISTRQSATTRPWLFSSLRSAS